MSLLMQRLFAAPAACSTAHAAQQLASRGLRVLSALCCQQQLQQQLRLGLVVTGSCWCVLAGLQLGCWCICSMEGR
jgi:hypothetical protein